MNSLQERIQAVLLDDSRTKEAVIEVMNVNGNVTLGGMVSSEEVSEAAESIVKELTGVVTVVNEIQIRKKNDGSDFNIPGTPNEDVFIE